MKTPVDSMRVFGPIRPLDVRSLAGPVVEVSVPAGAHLVREGNVIGTFFVIRAGTAELWRGKRLVAALSAGDCFGEIEPVPTRQQRFSVIASAPMRVLTFSAFGIGRLCATIPDARERILAALPGESVAPAPEVSPLESSSVREAMMSLVAAGS